MKYKLATDGDGFEKYYCNLFICKQFPSYEKFWSNYITPLTNRPTDIHFKTDSELQNINRGAHDICIAQLHYTVLKHLARVFDLKQINPLNFDQFVESMTRLCSSLDVADELLERFGNNQLYDPWSEEAGKKARQNWRLKHKELRHLRNYRNKLLHGRISPTVNVIGSYPRLRIPKFDKVDVYLDWRKVTNHSVSFYTDVHDDYDSPNNLLNAVWDDTLKYLEENWKNVLLKE